jgi:hypothetical protein
MQIVMYLFKKWNKTQVIADFSMEQLFVAWMIASKIIVV